jgi:phosphatidylcholine synthase
LEFYRISAKNELIMDITKKEYAWWQKALAWSVHLFTATGILCGFMAILAVSHYEWRSAAFWLLLCQVIDGVDGTFARMCRVRDVLPFMNGKMMDYVIDFTTYAVIPAYFFYQAGLVEGSWGLVCTFMILLVSAIYYGREGMVSEDMYFMGFPVLWNIVVFFLFFVVDFSSWGNALAIIVLSALHFAPIKFVYPSRAGRFQGLTLAVSILMGLAAIAILIIFPVRIGWLNAIVLAGAGYFGVLTVMASVRGKGKGK